MDAEHVIENGSQGILPIVSKDGQSTDLWSYDLTRGTKARLTSDPGFKTMVIWEPNGGAVVFSSNAKGSPHIYRMKSDGGPTETVLETEGMSEIPGSVCRDDRYLAYRRVQVGATTVSIWILPLFGERKPFALVETPFQNIDARFSPDCKWVAYTSTRQDKMRSTLPSFQAEGGGIKCPSKEGNRRTGVGMARSSFIFPCHKTA